MTFVIDDTHDPNLTSWVESANDASTDFPLQNLPYCRFRHGGQRRIGSAIGEFVIDLASLAESNLLPDEVAPFCRHDSLRPLMESDETLRRSLRRSLISLLANSDSALAHNRSLRQQVLLPHTDVELLLPCCIGNYTDFYASVFHATNVGSMFRPDNPLLPNYKHIPIGYHGRASSVVVSGHPVVRPNGQRPPREGESQPTFGPCENLDYELEMGLLVGRGNELGQAIPLNEVERHMFGLVLVNDWSARDFQRWEYQPLGPFLAKSFATTISPWVVSMEALAPFRVPAAPRPSEDPQPLPYLNSEADRATGAFDIVLSVWLSTQAMRSQGMTPQRLSRGNFREMYWTLGQMMAHHTSNGCNLRSGDLLASGTVSGSQRDARGCLLELTWNGEYGAPVPGNQRTPLELPTGEKRVYLADGDRVILRARCERAGYRSIGFGECWGDIMAAVDKSS